MQAGRIGQEPVQYIVAVIAPSFVILVESLRGMHDQLGRAVTADLHLAKRRPATDRSRSAESKSAICTNHGQAIPSQTVLETQRAQMKQNSSPRVERPDQANMRDVEFAQ